ncbi:hypothetical protein [Brevundimonas sp.]|uniref:hypothetical protein n=1 Tax=Brevundimonas sp. TaxID=1871086 RepID=UPI002D462A16|nr:hypothetical protein [Brevundimonas sp.]HYC73465.1 hypothetical protein [Brevundimonas sp.]
MTTTVGELEGGLLDELKKVVAATNEAALAQAEEEQRQRQAHADQEKARRDALAEGAKRLKFD